MKIVLIACGQRTECNLKDLRERVKTLSLETNGVARIIEHIKRAAEEGRSGKINSADGYQISYQFKGNNT